MSVTHIAPFIRRIRRAWQQHFVTNMFIRANDESDLEGFEPDFTVINACSQVNEDWKKHGLNSEVAVVSPLGYE